MAVSAFKNLITLLQNGDDVDAAVLNAILRELQNNSVYLRDLFSDALLGETVFAREVTLESSAAVGMAVYYDSASATWKRGLAAATIDDSGNVTISENGQVWGIVFQKTNSTLGDILLTGTAEVDLSSAIDGTVVSGQYFLSGIDAGKLQLSSPPVGIPVLQVAGPGATAGTHKVFVKTSFLDFFNSHQHYKFDLVAAPAGTASLSGGRWTIPTPDTASAGWLPADNAVFNGNAPVGAVFGYNISASSIGGVWPPLPVESAVIEWNTGESADVGYTGVPPNLVIMDQYGIWWMSDCEDDVPWPADINGTTTTTSTTNTTPECPRDLGMGIRVFFTKMAFQTDNTLVSSLQVHPDSVGTLVITCVDDDLPATTGALQIKLDLPFVQKDADDLGNQFIKTLSGGDLNRGPGVTRIKAGSNNVQIAGTTSGSYKYGDLTITVTETSTGSILPFEIVRLDGVEEENYEDVLALMFPPSKTTSLRARLLVPDLSVSKVELKIRTWWMGRVAGTFPPLTCAYREVTQPSPATTPIALPTSDTAVAMDGTGVSFASADEYFELDSASFEVDPNSVVLFDISRPGAGGDGYAGELHLIKRFGVITGTTS